MWREIMSKLFDLLDILKNMEEMKQITVPIPPLDIQQKVVDFLKVVEELVSVENKISDLYLEYKNSLIYELVTHKKEVL